MKRYWILLLTELKACRHDPISFVGGLALPVALLAIFGLMFTGERQFPVAVVNRDVGPSGQVLIDTLREVRSPFNQPYYKVLNVSEAQAWESYRSQRLDAIWVIPAEFSSRLAKGEHPTIEMYFTNYMDDRGKNHRIYSSEVLWSFYKKIGQPGPPLETVEEYPLPEMVDWFWIIGVGLVLLTSTLGSMFNIFMLTYGERISRITLEFGMAPRPLPLVLLPKVVLALAMGLLFGTLMMGVLYLWSGISPGSFIWPAYLVCGLVALFWISVMLVAGMRARHQMAGAIGAVLTGVIVFFTGGGISMVRYYPEELLRFARFFPNTHAIDPLRELILFHSWPATWNQTLLILTAFAAVGLAVSLVSTERQLRRLG